ncbi:HET-domain-containing protein, partial [Trematosphaeria pertusa]
CELEHARRSNFPDYTALSYTWGSSSDTRPIYVDGGLVEAGVNLEEALRALRDHTPTRVLWCDQLCINQGDDAEKSDQVQQMKEIYSDATRVIAWLGPAADNSDALMSRLRELDLVSDESADHSALLASYARDEELTWIPKAFDDFCKRSYWRRLWVIQEFAVAKDLYVLCGSAMLSAAHLANAVQSLFKLQGQIHDHVFRSEKIPCGLETMERSYSSSALSFVMAITTRRSRHHNSDPSRSDSLFRVLVTSLVLEIDYNHPDCTDARDRVFSVLGLATDAADFEGFPDYSKGSEEVYEELTRKLLQKGEIDILSYCQFPRKIRDREMSSWAPDWDTPIRRPCAKSPWFSSFSASGDTLAEQEVCFPSPRALTLKVVFVDFVEKVGNLWDPDWMSTLEPGDIMSYLAEIWTLCEESPRIQEDEKAAATSRIAIADRLVATTPELQSASVALWAALVQKFGPQATTVQPASSENTSFERLLTVYMEQFKNLHSRRPFRSRTGYVGLAPAGAINGDVVVVILGGKTPYVLRARAEGGYTLVGEVYVHGIMYGELLK